MISSFKNSEFNFKTFCFQNFKEKKKFIPQISWSKFQALSFEILNLKISDYKFQISIQNLKVSKSQNFKC